MVTRSPMDLDRGVRAATAEWRSASRGLRGLLWASDGASAALAQRSPLMRHRDWLRKDTHDALVEAAASGGGAFPDAGFAAAAASHVARLTIERVTWDEGLAAAEALHARTIALAPEVASSLRSADSPLDPSAALCSVAALVRALIADPVEGRRRAMARVLAEHARPASRAVARAAARRSQAAAALGISIDAVDLDGPRADLERAARAFLDRTDGASERFSPWDEGLHRAMARGAADGWPARPSERWLAEIFRGFVTEGGLGEIALPPAWGAASYCRALALFGIAFAHAALPSPVPFVIARPVVDLRPGRIAAVFGGLPATPAFGRVALRLGPARARDQARLIAAALRTTLRLWAAALLVHGALSRGEASFEDAFQEVTASAWGEPLPPSIAGVLPAMLGDLPVRFASLLLGARDAAALVDAYDDDWFANPRAVEAVRAIAEAPPPVPEVPARKPSKIRALGSGLLVLADASFFDAPAPEAAPVPAPAPVPEPSQPARSQATAPSRAEILLDGVDRLARFLAEG